MGVLGEGSGWCFCSGVRKSERIKGGIFSSKGAAFAAISGAAGVAGCCGGGGTGFLIHRNLFLTTHANLPSASSAEAAEIRLSNGRLPAKLVPQRFFITSSILDLTIVGLDMVDNDSTSQVQLPHYLKTSCNNPNLELGSVVYLLGHADKKELMIGEGKIVIATDNLIKLSTDGVAWSHGSAGFDVQGNLAFMICDPMKLASSPTARSSASSSSPLSWKKDCTMQFGIPIPVIIDWLHQHWEGSLDEVSKPKLPLTRLMSSGQRSENSCASFAHRRVFKSTEDETDDIPSSSQMPQRAKPHSGSSNSANAKLSHDENPVVDLRSTHEQGILTPDIFESPKLTSGPSRKMENASGQVLEINFPLKSPKTIFLPLPLKKMLSDENNVPLGHAIQSRENCNPSQELPKVNGRREHKVVLPPVGTWQDDHRSEVESCSSPMDISEFQIEGDRLSSEEETMYSAETMESRNIPSPRDSKLQQVGRSKSCVNYSRWSSSQRNSVARNAALQKQHTLIPVRKSNSQTASLPQKSHDFYSPTVSSSMKKRNGSEEQPMRPRQSVVQVSPRWMF